MSRANVAAAKRIYAARNRWDVDAVLAECDPDVTWQPHLATLGGVPIRGHDGVREYMKSLQEDWEFFRHDPEEFIDAGDKVVALLHTYARGRESGAAVDVAVDRRLHGLGYGPHDLRHSLGIRQLPRS